MAGFLQDVEANPEFWNLDYQTQVEIRARVAAQRLASNPEFVSLHPKVKQDVLARIAFSPPAFKNKLFEQHVNQFTQAVRSGDPKARKDVVNYVSNYVFNSKWGLQEWLNKNIYFPFLDAVSKKAAGPDVRSAQEGGPTRYEYFYGDDRRKAVAYYSYLLGDAGNQSWAERMKTQKLPALAGSVADMATWWAATGGFSIGIGKLAQAGRMAGQTLAYETALAASKSTKPVSALWKWLSFNRQAGGVSALRFSQTAVGQTFLKEFPLQASQALVEGLGDVFRDYVKLGLERGKGATEAQRTLLEVAKIWGGGVARDFVWGMAMSSIIPMAKQLPKVFSKKGYGDVLQQLKHATNLEQMEGIRMAMAGYDIPDRVLARTPEYVKERILTIRNMADTMADPRKMAPAGFNETQANAFFSGASFIKTTDGKYRLRPYADWELDKVTYGPNKAAEFGTLGEAQDALVKRYASLRPEQMAETPFNYHMLNRARQMQWIDSVLDPTGPVRKTAIGMEVKPTPKEVQGMINKRRAQISSGQFIPASERQFISPMEAEVASGRAAKRGGIVYQVSMDDLGKEASRQLRGGQNVEIKNRDFDLSKAGQGEIYIFTQKTANQAEYQYAAEVAKTMEGVTPEDVLARYGYDAVVEGNTLRPLKSEMIKVSSLNVDPETGRWLKHAAESKSGVSSLGRDATRLLVKQKLTAAIPLSRLAGDEQIMSRMLASSLEGGKVKLEGIRDWAAVFVSKYGIRPDMIDVRVVPSTRRAAVVVRTVGEKTLEIQVPQVLASSGAERVFIHSLVDRIDEALQTKLFPDTRLLKGEYPEWLRDRPEGGTQFGVREEIQKASSVLKSYEKLLEKGKVYSTLWGTEKASAEFLKSVGKKGNIGELRILPDGSVELMEAGAAGAKPLAKWKNLDEAYGAIVPRAMSKADIQTLVRNRGLRLTEQTGFFPDGSSRWVIEDPNGNLKPEYGKNPQEVLQNSGLNYKLPARYMPESVVIDEGMANITFDGRQAMVNSIPEANKILSQFDHNFLDKRLLFSSENLEAFRVGTKYMVTDIDLRHTKFFNNLAEGKAWFKDAIQNNKKLNDLALAKGIQINHIGGAWEVIAEGKYFRAASAEEAKRLVGSYPSTAEGPELIDTNGDLGDIPSFIKGQEELRDFSGVDFSGIRRPPDALQAARESALADLEYYEGTEAAAKGLGEEGVELRRTAEKLAGGAGEAYGKAARTPLRLELSHYLRPMDELIPQMAEKSGHTQLLDSWRKMEDGLRLVDVETKHYYGLLERAFMVPGKHGRLHLMKPDDCRLMYQYLTASPEEVDKVVQELKITGDMKAAAEQVKDILGRLPHQGLHSRLIDNPYKFLFEYLPRFKTQFQKMRPGVLEAMKLDIDKATAIMGVSEEALPKEIRFAANEQRLLDVLLLSVEDNALIALKRYTQLGLKRAYLNPIWKDMGAYIKANGEAIPETLTKTLALYQKHVMGIAPSFGVKHMRRMGQELAKRMGADKVAMNNVVNSLFSVSYMATMGFRPHLPFRNMWQVYTTLAPRVGTANVNWALKEMGSDSQTAKLAFEHLQSIGAVSSHLPVWTEVATRESTLGKMTEASLWVFKNSDDMTRITAYLAATKSWDDAMDLVRKGAITPEQFFEAAQVNTVDPYIQRQVADLMKAGQLDAARDAFSIRMIKDTMFDYRPAMRPRIFSSSVVGQVFGQFGTYPVYYVANLLKGFRYGTRMQKIAFAATWLRNTAALWGAYESMGLNGKNFLPWGPMQFSGGPIWQGALDLIAANSPGYKGKEARGKLKNWAPFDLVDAIIRGEPVDWTKVPDMVPGSIQYRNIRQAVEAAGQGDPLRAFGFLMSAPVKAEDPEVWDRIMEMYPTRSFDQPVPSEGRVTRSALRRR